MQLDADGTAEGPAEGPEEGAVPASGGGRPAAAGAGLLRRRRTASEVGLEKVEERVQLRAVVASDALRGLGRMLRRDDPVFEFSMLADTIDDFWSYSRSANVWANTSNLLLYYNVLPSATAAVLTSLLLGLLMPLSWTGRFQMGGIVASLASAFVFLLVLIIWRPQRHVFLDKAYSLYTN